MIYRNDLFSQAKDSLDIKSVAQYYGLGLDRNGKALCPFHNDTHPSLSFKGQFFKCFSCDEGGDVIKLVGELLGISKPFDVLKRLNDDFLLGLKIDREKQSRQEIAKQIERQKERERRQLLEQDFSRWVKESFKTCSTYLKLLRDWRERYAPKNESEEFHPLFKESLLELSRVEYLCECLAFGNRKELEQFYKMRRNEVKDIEKRIREHRKNAA